MAQWLSESLGQAFVVENRIGASGNLAAEAVVRAKADGYTLLLASASDAINATLYDNLNFSFIRDIAPVAGLGGAVLPGSPAEFGKYIADETEKWAKVIKFADIKPQ
jgi:tripartite-type tricarboxylate transporter receptor subunit TctC